TLPLGAPPDTDAAQGPETGRRDASGVEDAALRAGAAALTGEIEQTAPQVSATKVNGKQAYKTAREGEAVELKARPVTVSEFTVLDIRREGQTVDADVRVTCSSGAHPQRGAPAPSAPPPPRARPPRRRPARPARR